MAAFPGTAGILAGTKWNARAGKDAGGPREDQTTFGLIGKFRVALAAGAAAQLIPMRQILTTCMFLVVAVASHGTSQTLATTAPAVGAIRWDAWHEEKSDVGKAVAKSLSPGKWQARLPFFANVAADGTISMDGDTTDVMEREIRYAKSAGLDYWAFVAYDVENPLSLGLRRYLESPTRNDVRFCVISETNRWRPETAAAMAARFAELMLLPNYQTVLGARPLFYFLNHEMEATDSAWAGTGGFRTAVDALRAAARKRGLQEPYCAVMAPWPEKAKLFAERADCDAISAYAVQDGGSGAPYAELAKFTEQFWERCAATDAKVIPLVMTGWDRRPRVENPVPWEKNTGWNADTGRYYLAPRPGELAEHLRRAITWNRQHPAVAEANSIIIYAWNEHDEGGWLCPTSGAGERRVNEVSTVLVPK